MLATFSICPMVNPMADRRFTPLPPGRRRFNLFFTENWPRVVPCSCGVLPVAPLYSTKYVKKGDPGSASNRGRTYDVCAISCASCGLSTPYLRNSLDVFELWADLVALGPLE